MAKAIYFYEYWSIKKSKNDFERDVFKLMKNAGFRKNMENVGKCRDIKPVATERRRNYFVSDYQIIILQSFSKNIY